MSKKPQKRRCSKPGCRAWAMHGVDYCSAHRPGGIPGRGAKQGNLNALKHGLYSRVMAEKVEEYMKQSCDENTDMDAELRLARAFIMYIASCAKDLTSSPDPDYALIARLSHAFFYGLRQVIKLLETKKAAPGLKDVLEDVWRDWENEQTAQQENEREN